MKIKLYYILGLAFSIASTACEKDNYEAPSSTLKGRIVYNGEPINVEYNQVRFELWESGWGKMTPINVAIAPDGSYSALLFDGNYKLVFPGAEGPFMKPKSAETNSDTIMIRLNGNQDFDIEVMPYFMVRNAQFSVANQTVSASFQLEQIITDENAKDVEWVSLYINKTQFVSGANNIASSTLNRADISDLNNVALTVDIPEMTRTQDYVFARIGIKIAGVEDMLFSSVQKVQF